MIDYKKELVFDFRDFFKLSVLEAGEAYSWEEAFLLLEALSSKSTSLYGSKKIGLLFPASDADLVALDDLYINFGRDRKQSDYDSFVKAYPDPRPKAIEKTLNRKNMKLTLEEARIKYAPKITTLTDEEILAKNASYDWEMNHQQNLLKA